jgi:hypothetical protein
MENRKKESRWINATTMDQKWHDRSLFLHSFLCCDNVATLALGSRPRQGFARVRVKKGARECGRVWEWTLTLPGGLSKLQRAITKVNPSPWGVLYIIEKLLKRRCPKWAHMTHLDIFNTSYGQKKGRESNWHLTPNHGKLGIDPIPLRAGGVRHAFGKLLTRATTSV